ncbi:MAG: hypothetical protein RTU09_02390 [Candidatus Thorarchaeota archaeon]
MSEEPAAPTINDKPVNPNVVGIVMALVALIAPLAFSIAVYDGLHLSVNAVLWGFISSPYQTYLEIVSIFTVVTMMPFGFLRLAYAYQMVRLYKGQTTKKRTLALGIVSELPFAMVSILYIIMWFFNPFNPMGLAGPTLILLIVGTLIIRLKPPPESPEMWKEMPEEKPWWVEESMNA